MHRTVSSWPDFQRHWDGVINFLLSADCVPFSFTMPAVEEVIDIIRRDDDARIWRGAKGQTLDKTDIADAFRKLPLAETVDAHFQMSHFKLDKFYGQGQLFEGFEEQVLKPWQEALTAAGFSWTRCYPILFISGPGCATNYHLDYSHVLAWQRHGSKRFVGLKDPERWAPLATRLHAAGVHKPAGISEEDVLSYEMQAGDVLWNCFLTPHWVEASAEVSYSINLSHGGLRFQGKLCRHEQELEDWRQAHPEEQELGVVKT
jgi:hypothetical protein